MFYKAGDAVGTCKRRKARSDSKKTATEWRLWPRKGREREVSERRKTQARAGEADTRHGPLGTFPAQARAGKNFSRMINPATT